MNAKYCLKITVIFQTYKVSAHLVLHCHPVVTVFIAVPNLNRHQYVTLQFTAYFKVLFLQSKNVYIFFKCSQ